MIVKGLAAAYVGRRDIASSDDSKFQYIHCISYSSVEGLQNFNAKTSEFFQVLSDCRSVSMRPDRVAPTIRLLGVLRRLNLGLLV